jgi:hypothetical protein
MRAVAAQTTVLFVVTSARTSDPKIVSVLTETFATSIQILRRKAAGAIPDEVIGFFN